MPNYIPRPWAILALLATLIAVFLARSGSSPAGGERELYSHVQGKNNTALFLVNSNYGFSNVHLATAYTLMEKHPEVELHFASHGRATPRVKRVEEAGLAANPAAQPLPMHLLPAADYEVALREGVEGFEEDAIVIPPGQASIAFQLANLWRLVAPWEPADHLAIYRRCQELFAEIDPAVVVIDPMFAPAVEAVRDANRLYIVLSSITLEHFITGQPWLKGFWKYPAVGTGYGYPLSWSNMFLNIYGVVRHIFGVLTAPGADEARDFLREGGVQNPLDLVDYHRVDAPWLTQATPGASFPLDHLPPNVTMVGPIILSLASLEEQDPEIVRWLEGAPTVIVNLGTVFRYSEERARTMAEALRAVMERTDYQVLWKLQKAGEYGDEFAEAIRGYVDEGRVRIEKWLKADPGELVRSPHVVASVNHGGSNCYHEALSAGVPQIILPAWLDTYDFATMAEYGGFGIWGSKASAPDWTAEGLTASFLKVLGDGKEGAAMKERARELGEQARASPGRETAAQIVAGYAGSGRK